MATTPAQIAALREIVDLGGRIGHGLGVSVSTIRALERQGLVTVQWGRTRSELAPAGWTGRVYTSHSWFAEITAAGREAVA